MPELRSIQLSMIDEPPLPMRATMDDEALRELGQSILQVGLQQPITVTEHKHICSVENDCPADGDGVCEVAGFVRYQIVTGHRRFIAHRQIGAHEILCIVRQPGEVEVAAAMIAENLCREDVNPAEEAIWLSQLVEVHSYSEADLMRATRRNADYIGDRFRLLRGDEQVFHAVLRKDVNFSVGRELNKCPDESMRRYYLDAAIRGGHSARVVHGWIEQWRANQVPQQAQQTQPTAPVEHPEGEPVKVCCATCGGDRDPYNLMWVQIHKHCWSEVQQMLGALARG